MSAPEKTPEPIPESPDDMPVCQGNDEHWLRNLIVTLHYFQVVDIHYEEDRHRDEHAGHWEVIIETCGQRFKAKHEDIVNALWYVTTIASRCQEAAWAARETAREKALAKLSPEDKKVLRIGDA